MELKINSNNIVAGLLGKKYQFFIENRTNGMSIEDAMALAEKKEEARLKRHLAYLARKKKLEESEFDEDDYYSGLYDDDDKDETPADDPWSGLNPDEDEGAEVEEYEYIPLEDEAPSSEEVSDSASKLQRLNMGMLEQIAVTILKRSLYYCPIDTGQLRDSARLIKTSSGFAIRYYADYAVYVHEWDYRHESPTQKKFLADAAVETFNNLRVTEPNIILPSVRLLIDPLTLYINVNTSQGYELFDKDWLGGNIEWGMNDIGPFEMFDRYLQADPEYLGELWDNIEDLDRKTLLSEDVADMWTAVIYNRYQNQFRKGR